MADFTFVYDRAFDEAAIAAITSDVDGDQATNHYLPVGFGDCALLECGLLIATIATVVANPELLGPSFQLVDAGGSATDVPFCTRWVRNSAVSLAGWAAPDQVQFWRATDGLRVTFSEPDTNAVPTADAILWAKVRRLRPEINRTPEETHFFLTS